MATTVNQQASTAFRGCDVLVTLNATETLSKLPNITVGQLCTVGSSSLTGYVSFVDYYGHSYRISPKTPATELSSSSTPGYLAAAETITLA
jgi:hypothetical protein